MNKTPGFVLFAAIVVLGLYFLSSSGRKAPLIPADELHKIITTEAGCLECHAPGRRAQLKPSHPPKEQCLVCHKVKKLEADMRK